MTMQLGGFARSWIVLTAAILVAGTVAVTGPAHALTPQQLNRGQLGSIKVHALNSQSKILHWCSGSVVHPKGYVLTLWTCVGLLTNEPDDSGQGLQGGDLYHPTGLVALSPTKDVKQAPVITYLGQVVAGSPDQNVAVVKIISMNVRSQRLPANLGLVTLPQGDAERVQRGETLHLAGYPVQGELVSSATTAAAGFDDIDSDGKMDRITLSSNPALGIGSAGLNDAGEQVGLFARLQNQARLVMSNVAGAYVEQALKAEGLTPEGRPGPGPGLTPPRPGGGPFGTMRFGADLSDTGALIGPTTQFAANARKVVAQWDYQGMRDGTRWGYVWSLDGRPVVDKPNTFSWEGGATGQWSAWITNDQGIAVGKWDVALYIQGKEVQRGSYAVGGGSGPGRVNPQPTDQGVVVKGAMVDADTKRGIPGGLLAIFKPGVTLEQIDTAEGDTFDKLLAAFAETDQNGAYQTSPPIARGQTYTVVAAGKGYSRRVFENGLELGPDDPSVWESESIALKKR